MAGVPSLAGQPQRFLENQMVLIREGLRGNPEMQALLRGMKDGEIVALAAHFAGLAPRPATQDRGDPARIERGRALARKLRCGVCHRPDFSGQNQVPRLAGQREDYLVYAMRQFRDDPRPGGDTLMADALSGVPDEDIAALAHFLARAPNLLRSAGNTTRSR